MCVCVCVRISSKYPSFLLFCSVLVLLQLLKEPEQNLNQLSLSGLACPCLDRRPAVAGPCLPRGGRHRRLERPADAPHARHSIALLLLQLPLGPQPLATTTQTAVCRHHESQSCSGTDEGVCPFAVLHMIAQYVICTTSQEFGHTL